MFAYPAECESYAGVAGQTVDANAEVTKIFIDRVQNFARPMAWATEFFDEVPVIDDGAVYLQNETKQAVRVAKVGQDGGIRSTFVTKNQSQVQIQLFLISSQKVKWRLYDLLRGSVAEENEKLVEIAQDVVLDLDGRLFTNFISPSAGSFNFSTGSDELKTLNLHPTVVATNLPTTNVISGLTAAGGVNKSVLDAVFKHFGRFANLFPDGDIYPVAFYFPSIYSYSILGDISLTNAAAGTQKLAEQVISRGVIDNYMNRQLAYRPLVNLGGKNVWVRTNKPLGKLYRKKSWDKMVRKINDDDNEGSAQARLCFGAAVPEPSRINILKIPVEA
jgi:hypothetical protein